jgi:hypothetical protein
MNNLRSKIIKMDVRFKDSEVKNAKEARLYFEMFSYRIETALIELKNLQHTIDKYYKLCLDYEKQGKDTEAIKLYNNAKNAAITKRYNLEK